MRTDTQAVTQLVNQHHNGASSAAVTNNKQLLLGLALCATVAATAIAIGQIAWFGSHGLSALTVAILLGIIIGNTWFPKIAHTVGSGVTYSKQTLLRAGVILYGLRLTLQDIGHVGLGGVLIDALVLSSTFSLALLLGTRLFKLDRTTAILIGAGSSICGAAAVMATEPVVRAHSEKVTVAVSTVVVFGTIAIFLYPPLFELNQHWGLVPEGARAFGIYAGSTIHEVAQVVAAARSVGPDAATTAVITKMVRVMMLAPFLIALSAWLSRSNAHQVEAAHADKPKLAVPWFAFIFIGVVIFNSFSLLPKAVVDFAINLDTLLLAMAMAALGLTTHISAIRKAGVKPLMLAAILFAWLIIGGALINHFVSMIFH